MIHSAHDLTDGARLQADVCIAGSGAAGTTLARELRGSGLDVILLEGGGLDEEAAMQALYVGNMSGIDTWELDRKRIRVLGGSTLHWNGWCRPLTPDLFEPRSFIPYSGWPTTYDALVPYYRRAHETVELGGFNYDAAAISAAADLPMMLGDSDVVVNDIFQYSPPTRFGARYREDLDEAEDLRVYLYASVVNISLNAGLDGVSRFECATLEGATFAVEAHRYVLAMGGLENPRIMLASNKQLDSGVGNSSDTVGRYFMEHPHYFQSGAVLFSNPPDRRFYKPFTAEVADETRSRSLPVRGVWSLRPEVRRAEGLPAFTVQLIGADPDDTDTGELEPEKIRSLLRRLGPADAAVRLTCRVEQAPDPNSRVTLRDERDALGMPRLDLHWRIRPEDDRTLIRGLELLGAEIGAAGLGRLWTPASDGNYAWEPRAGGHHMGTTRMSVDPADGVVDANCAAHDVGNLFLAGSSVFPTGGAANPTLTIVALAHRLADYLRETK